MGALADAPEFEVLSEDGGLTLSFELINNHLIIPVSVKGSRFEVILDTGMPISSLLLYGTEDVERLDLSYGPMRVRVGGAGGDGEPLEASLAHGAAVDIGKARMKNATVLVLPPIQRLMSYHDGVIGAAIFDSFVVQIDYDEQRIHLHDPETYSPPDDVAVLPVTFRHRIPFAKVRVTTGEGREIPLEVAVDLGASHAISLNIDTDERLAVPDKALRTVVGRGVGGEIRGQVGRVGSLAFAGFTFVDVVATFPDAEHQHPGGMDSKNGNLGSGMLKRFNVTFDYPNERMLLAPNERFEEPFEWDMSGMRLEPLATTGLRVEDLIANSPAEKAGLAVGDVVTHVNGRPASERNLFELKKLMQQDGAVLEITATRNGKPLELKLKLRRLV
jgi:hypothetical protein